METAFGKFQEGCCRNASEMKWAAAKMTMMTKMTMKAHELRRDSCIMASLKKKSRLLVNHNRILVSALVTAKLTKRVLYTDVCWRVTLNRPITLTTRTFKVMNSNDRFRSLNAFGCYQLTIDCGVVLVSFQ